MDQGQEPRASRLRARDAYRFEQTHRFKIKVTTARPADLTDMGQNRRLGRRYHRIVLLKMRSMRGRTIQVRPLFIFRPSENTRMVDVARFAASAGPSLDVRITATCRRTSSRANSSRRSTLGGPPRYSMATFWRSTYPASFKPW